MPEVTVDVAGRSYRLGCGEGEEEHLTALAVTVDAEARGLLRQFGQMSDGRLLLQTALMIADRLGESENRLHEIEQRLGKAEQLADSRSQPSDMFSAEREEKLTRRINLLADEIEAAASEGGD